MAAQGLARKVAEQRGTSQASGRCNEAAALPQPTFSQRSRLLKAPLLFLRNTLC
jgi:hypothetical protein